jgi:hypothetical protein
MKNVFKKKNMYKQKKKKKMTPASQHRRPQKVGKIDFDFADFFGIFVPQTDHIYLEIFRKLLIRVCYNKNILVTSTMFNRLIYYRSSIINPRWDIDLNPASSKMEILWMHPRKCVYTGTAEWLGTRDMQHMPYGTGS